MLNKNDPLIAAVQKVMQTNQAERDAIAAVNEKFAVTDRRALPRERQHEWDSAYAKVLTEGAEGSIPRTPKERELARAYGDPTRITHGDVLRKRGVSEGKMTKSDIAALKHPKKKITGDDLAALRAGEHKMEEAKKMKGDDPCWKGYEMVGMKKKGGKEVPNCVPVKEEGDPNKAIRQDAMKAAE